ncbi:unnamed protein product [Medioppia subpectinata]|uniref:Uncharacterized protein n=1 Tax=Medioppia subpectinata TaxID=1979941 RepID=A0A7R9KDF8_9ACAR|nr:unnamed protein product [Medioppia subpectinata]CAG2100584.1 unnamed protein product [Medioppia subpectinata]
MSIIKLHVNPQISVVMKLIYNLFVIALIGLNCCLVDSGSAKGVNRDSDSETNAQQNQESNPTYYWVYYVLIVVFIIAALVIAIVMYMTFTYNPKPVVKVIVVKRPEEKKPVKTKPKPNDNKPNDTNKKSDQMKDTNSKETKDNSSELKEMFSIKIDDSDDNTSTDESKPKSTGAPIKRAESTSFSTSKHPTLGPESAPIERHMF